MPGRSRHQWGLQKKQKEVSGAVSCQVLRYRSIALRTDYCSPTDDITFITVENSGLTSLFNAR